MHHIYSTKAFVLNSFPFGEAGKVLILLTEDLGVISVTAQGTRKIESKLRQSIQDFCLTDVALVYGKGGWRLINAAIEENYFHQLDTEIIQTVSKVFSLIQRMIPEEEINKNIFNYVLEMLDLLKNQKDFSLSSIEIATVIKVMNELGYVADESGLYNQLNKKFSEFVGYVSQNETKIVKMINHAIQESHL